MTRVRERRYGPSDLVGCVILLMGLAACGRSCDSDGGRVSSDKAIRLASHDGAPAEDALFSTETMTSTADSENPDDEDTPVAGQAEAQAEQAAERKKQEDDEARAARKARIRAKMEADRAEMKAMADMTPEERHAAMRARMEERRKEFEARFPQSAGQRFPPGKAKPAEPKAFPGTDAAGSARRKPTEGSSTAQPVSPPPVYSADDNEIATRRLAVLTTQDLQSAGYSDLLTAKLTEQLAEHLELVERDAIDQVLGEFQISELFGGANAVEERISLGRLLRADVLLLLSREAIDSADGESARSIRSLMVDTGTGARLGLDAFPDAADLDQTTDAVLAQANDMLHRYPHGVERIVGVSHFLSRCLTHAYDGYQTSCAAILSDTLSRQKGVAVLEIEEARAISDELAITLTKAEGAGGTNMLHRRVVPILVSGEFRVEPKEGSERFQITASIQRTGKTPESVSQASLDSEGLRAFLSETLPRKVLDEGGDGGLFRASGHSVDSQFAWLCAEAQRFDRIGLREQAAGLREAALLLKPADVEVRYKLIRDYLYQMARPFPLPKHVADLPSEEEIRKEYRSRIPFYKLTVAHIEYMIRNRLILKEDIADGTPHTRVLPMRENRLSPAAFMATACESCIPQKLPFEEYDASHRNYRLGKRLSEIGHEELAVCRETEKYFLEEVFPLVRYLPTEHPKEARLQFAAESIDLLLSPRYYDHLSETERLARLEDALTQDTPVGTKLNRDFLTYVRNQVAGCCNKWKDAEKEGKNPDEAVQADPWHQLLTRLSNNRRRDAQFYGKLGLALIDLELWQAKWRVACREFKDEAKEMGLEIVGQYGHILSEKRPEFAQELTAIEQTFNELKEWSKPNDPLFDRGMRMAALPLRDIETIRTNELTSPEARPDQGPRLVQRAFRPGAEHWPRFQVTEPIPYMVKTLDGQHRPVVDDYWPRLHRRWDPNYRWSIDTR